MRVAATAEPSDLTDYLLSRDLKQAGRTLTPSEIRFYVDLYYQLQEFRKANANMVRASGKARAAESAAPEERAEAEDSTENAERAGDQESAGPPERAAIPESTVSPERSEPHELLRWFSDRFERLEAQIPKVMGDYVANRRDGRWAISQHGIGPVISAGLLAHIDITRAPTAGHIWSFAGLKPKYEWAKGERRPYNLSLKVLCWKIGDSFVKQSGSPKCHYGHIYLERKKYEEARNATGYNKGIEVRRKGKTTTEDEAPPFILDLRARRYAVKLFLAHLHHVMYECHYATPPPMPYILTQPGHVHYVGPPGWPCE